MGFPGNESHELNPSSSCGQCLEKIAASGVHKIVPPSREDAASGHAVLDETGEKLDEAGKIR